MEGEGVCREVFVGVDWGGKGVDCCEMGMARRI